MLNIGGFVSFSTVDFPGKLAAVLFCQGCPWRCPYCHNPHLQNPAAGGSFAWGYILNFLENRKKLLEGVVFSGGEPLMQPEIAEAVRAVRGLGYEVALHTAGMFPERLKEVLPSLDFAALDVKVPFSRYDSQIPGASGAALKNIGVSLSLILESGLPYEVRTTVDPRLMNREEFLGLAEDLAGRGVKRYAAQVCRENAQGAPRPVPDSCLFEPGVLDRLRELFPEFEFRS